MKNNKILILTISIIISIPFTGCTTKGSDAPETVVASVEEPPEKRNIISIPEITLPSYLEGPETDLFSVVEEGADSITYQFTGDQQAEAVDQIAAQIKDSIGQVLHDKQFYPNIVGISVNDDFSEFNVTFLETETNIYESTLRMSLYIAGDRFQIYQGNAEDTLLTVVNYIQDSTGEIFSTGDSSSLR